MVLWGSNRSARGQINYIRSESDPSAFVFEKNVGKDVSKGDPVKPVLTRIGPEGDLYYILTTYKIEEGQGIQSGPGTK